MKSIFHHIVALLKWLWPWRSHTTGDFRRHRRYSLQLVSHTSLSRVWQVTGRPFTLWVAAIAAFVTIGMLWLCACLYTPLRNVLPARMQADLRDNYVELSMRLDSAATRAAIADRYANNLRQILLDTLSQSTAQADMAHPERLPLDSLMEASAAERSFVARFEEAERYNLSVLSPIAAEGMTFYPPVKGVAQHSYLSDAGIPYTAYEVGTMTPVSVIYRGTVVNAYYSTGRGVTVAIQHPNDFLSIFSGLSESFVAKGEKVTAGQRIGLASSSSPSPLTFELWHNGAPLPADEYISF